MSNRTYDSLKFVAQVVLPALATLYTALAAAWGFSHVEAIVGTITAIDLFLGSLLGITSRNYSPPVDGTLLIDHKNKEAYAALERPAADLAKTAVLKVETPND
nr:MAG TPA: holin [Caudoviricetes sp.]